MAGMCRFARGRNDFAQKVFQILPDVLPKILLTSRFRRCDRSAAEKQSDRLRDAAEPGNS